MTAPVILTVAPNGAYKTKSDHPALPITARELAETARSCLDAGAAMIHLHVRDSQGRHLLDADAYAQATQAIRRAVGDDLVIQVTSEAAGRYQPAHQMAVIRATRPEAVSVALREIVPDQAAEPEAASFWSWAHAAGIMVQTILYDRTDVLRYTDLKARGIIPDGKDFLLYVLGRYSQGQTSAPADLLPFLAAAPPRPAWAVCAFGPQENACALAATCLGGHVRVGFENNLFLADGTQAPDNASLVAQATAGARLINRPLGDAAYVRALFG